MPAEQFVGASGQTLADGQPARVRREGISVGHPDSMGSSFRAKQVTLWRRIPYLFGKKEIRNSTVEHAAPTPGLVFFQPE